MTCPVAVRARLVETFRRDLVGPGLEDEDLARERLAENPSRWYLTGFIAPAEDEPAADDPAVQEEDDREAESETGSGAAGDDEPSEAPAARRRFLPSSIGLTVLLPLHVGMIEARVSWGDYVTEPPLPETVLLPREGADDVADRHVDWVRIPQQRSVSLTVETGRGRSWVSDSGAPQIARGGALELTTHTRAFSFLLPDGRKEHVRAVTVFLVNRRTPAKRRYADVAYAFQARLELVCQQGFSPRYDLSGYQAEDEDLRIADLHYRDIEDYAVGRNAAASWTADADGKVRRVWTDHLPLAEVERVAPNLDIPAVEFGMEALARLADEKGEGLTAELAPLPRLYAEWITQQQHGIGALAERRRATAERLIEGMRDAEARIGAGIALLQDDPRARLAFRIMNEAVARSARRRSAGPNGDPMKEPPPIWRPFQLAFILLNLSALVDKAHPDREIVDLLFFPTRA